MKLLDPLLPFLSIHGNTYIVKSGHIVRSNDVDVSFFYVEGQQVIAYFENEQDGAYEEVIHSLSVIKVFERVDF